MQQISRFPNLFGFKEVKMFGGTVAEIATKYGAGVQLCDGTNGTPDLRNQFIVGANADSGGVAKSTVSGAAAKSGGSATKDISHKHDQATIYSSSGGPTHGLASGSPAPFGTGAAATITDQYSMTGVSKSGNYLKTDTAGSAVQDVLNPYYALCFITRTADWA